MTDQCLRPQDLDALLEREPSPTWQDHLQSCAACRALLAEYRSFLTAEPLVGADPRAAEAALERRMPPDLRRPAPQNSGPSNSGRWSALLDGLRWRPALATAVAVVALLLVFWPQAGERLVDPSGQVRGVDPLAQDFVAEVQGVADHGGWVVQWSAVEEATGYRVEILDGAMTVVLSRLEDRTTAIELDPATVVDAARGPWFVRVIALADHRELGTTPLRELPPHR